MTIHSVCVDPQTPDTDSGRPYLRPEDTCLVRPLTQGGYELVLALDRPLNLQTLNLKK